MPVNKNAMTRYQILDELLSDPYRNYSLNDLREEVSNRLAELDGNSDGVVRRTIEKDIHYLEYEGPFMVEIERYSVEVFDREKQKTIIKKCLRYSDPGFSIFKKELSDDEKYILSEVFSLLGQFDGLPSLEGLDRLRSGLGISNPKKIISFTKNPLEHSNLLGELFTAISQKQAIEVTYHRFGSEERKTIILHPYLLKEYNRRWFLIAADEYDKKILTFGLERIDYVRFMPEFQYVEFKGDIEERFEDIIGVTNFYDKAVETILFWVSDYSKDYVETKPLHDSQKHYHNKKEDELRKTYPQLKGGAFFSIDCKENYELLRELTSFGANLIALQPESLRKEICDYVSEMKDAYSFL